MKERGARNSDDYFFALLFISYIFVISIIVLICLNPLLPFLRNVKSCQEHQDNFWWVSSWFALISMDIRTLKHPDVTDFGQKRTFVSWTSQNSGNASELLKLCRRFDPSIVEWICRSSTQDNSKYTWANWDTQNDVLLTLSHMVLRKIVQDVRNCGYWSLLMDVSQDITVKEKVVFAVRLVHPETFEVSDNSSDSQR